VRLLVGFPAGSGPDLVARLIGEHLSQELGQPWVIEDRPGAGSNIATDLAAHAPADGYTMMLLSGSNAWNASLYPNLSFDFLRDFAPVGSIYRAPAVMVVHPSVGVTTVREFIEKARKAPGTLNMASNGNGSTGHVYGSLFKMMTGIEMTHVPYQGNPLPDLLSGRTQVYFSPISSASEFIRDGKLVALGVTMAERWKLLPDVPTVAETVPGFEAFGWMGLGVPRQTDPAIVRKLYGALSAALAKPQTAKQIADVGGEIFAGSSDDFGRFMADYTQKWAGVIRQAHITPD
jgi:tripartite-type tricarboxylate transporter receptor subunit TctC